MKEFKYMFIAFFMLMGALVFAYEGVNLTIESVANENFAERKITIVKQIDYVKGQYKGYLVSYISDGLTIFAKMNVPDMNMPNAGFPVILVNHGYIAPHKYSTNNLYKLVDSYYARSGFITIKSDYRGWGDSGDPDHPVYDRIALFRDVHALLSGIGSIKEADTENVFVYGHSLGGEVTIKLLQTVKYGLINAASIWAPCYEDYPEVQLFFTARGSAQRRKNQIEVINKYIDTVDFPKHSTPNYIEWIDVPIILHHGSDDKSVPISWGNRLSEDLKRHGKDYIYHTYKDDHNFANVYFYQVLKRDVEFFKKHMK